MTAVAAVAAADRLCISRSLLQLAHAFPQVATNSLPNKKRRLSETFLTIVPHFCGRYNAPTMSSLSAFPTSNNLLPSSPNAPAPTANLVGLAADGRAGE